MQDEEQKSHDRIKSGRQPLSDGASQPPAASGSPKAHYTKKEVPTSTRLSTNASRRMTAPSFPLNHYGNSPPPPMPSKDKRRRASGNLPELSEGDNLPVRRLPQPKKASSTSQMEPFQRPATADMLDDRAEEDSPKHLRNRVSSFDRLPRDTSHSPSSRRRRNKQSLESILASRDLSSNSPSASALEKSYQPPKETGQHSMLEELEVSGKEERIENLPIQSGKTGLLKALTNGGKNGGDSAPIPVS